MSNCVNAKYIRGRCLPQLVERASYAASLPLILFQPSAVLSIKLIKDKKYILKNVYTYIYLFMLHECNHSVLEAGNKHRSGTLAHKTAKIQGLK